MPNSCREEGAYSSVHAIAEEAVSPLHSRWHTAVHVLYNDKIHSAQLETLTEIRAIAERIGEVVARTGIRVTRPDEIFEVQARVTFFMQPLPLYAINSDTSAAVIDEQLVHPRRFGFL